MKRVAAHARTRVCTEHEESDSEPRQTVRQIVKETGKKRLEVIVGGGRTVLLFHPAGVATCATSPLLMELRLVAPGHKAGSSLQCIINQAVILRALLFILTLLSLYTPLLYLP